MSDAVFAYDVFLSHSAKDKAVVRPLAERLLHFSAFILQPFRDAPIKGSMAQFFCVNWPRRIATRSE
jgi:hypothetical protein